MLNNLLDHLDPDSPVSWLLRLLLEGSRWVRLAVTLRRRPAQDPTRGKEGRGPLTQPGSGSPGGPP